MVLAGGYAKRLGLIGENTAKPLLPLGEKRVIDHIIDRVEELSEVDEIIVFTNEKFKKQFEGWLKNRRHGKPIRIVAEPSRSEKEKLGAVRALAWLLEKYGIDDECLIIAGDNFFHLKPQAAGRILLGEETQPSCRRIRAGQPPACQTVLSRRTGQGGQDHQLPGKA